MTCSGQNASLAPTATPSIVYLPAGSDVEYILDATVGPTLRPFARVFSAGRDVTAIPGFRTVEGERLIVALNPQGGDDDGKGILGAVLSIVVAVVAWYVAPAIVGGQIGGMAALTGSSALYAQIAAAAITMVGNMAISALVAPKANTARAKSAEQAQSYFLTGQSNQSRPYGPILRIYGRNRIAPAIASNPIIDNYGTVSKFSAIYDFGYGDIDVDFTSMKIGDVHYSQFAPEGLVLHRNSLGTALQHVTHRVGYDQMQIVPQPGATITLTTKPMTQSAELNLMFDRGLVKFDDQGKAKTQTATFQFSWRAAGTNDPWVPVGPPTIYGVAASANLVSPAVPAKVNFPGGTVSLYASFVDAQGTGLVRADATGSFLYWASRPPYKGMMTSGRAQIYESNGKPYAVVDQSLIWSGGAKPNFDLFSAPSTYSRILGALYEWQPAPNVTYQSPSAPAVYGTDVIFSAASTSALNAVIGFNFPAAGVYDIRVTRRSAIATDTRRSDSATINLLESRQAGTVMNLHQPHTMLEARFTATDKLSGVVQNLTAMATSVLRQTADGVTFTTGPTRNPAWIVLDLLTGTATPRPIADARIDWPSFVAFAAFCDEPITRTANGRTTTTNRFTSDFVVTERTTVQELVLSVLATCRASLKMTSAGKFGIMIDREMTTPRQLITPANSWGFSGARTFADIPHALKVKYTDGDSFAGTGRESWQQTECIVYADGYSAANATVFEDIDSLGITDYIHAWNFGRYMMAQGIMRSEVFSVTMDIEHLACQRGDLLRVAHDVPRIGGQSTRISEVSGNVVTITESLSSMPQSWTARRADGSVVSGSVVAMPGSNQFELNSAAGLADDDLIVFGMLTRVTEDYILASISPGANLTAELTMVKYDARVYVADEGAMPDWRPGFGDDLINGATDLAVVDATIESYQIEFYDRRPFGSTILTWRTIGVPAGSFVLWITHPDGSISEVKLDGNARRYEWNTDILAHPGWVGPTRFDITPFTKSGVAGAVDYVSGTVEPDRIAPGPIDGFGIDVQDMTIAIYWRPVQDEDADRYELRYSPDALSGTWSASQLIGELPYNITRTNVGARTGSYFLQAVDTSGNRSAIVHRRTTVEDLPSINFVERIDEAPLWPGTASGMTKVPLELDGAWGAVNPLGYYTFAEIVDLHDVMEVRVASKIRAHGAHRDDVMAMWVPLASAVPLSRAQSADWSASLEYRTIDGTIFMADWTPLTNPNADPIAGTGQSIWSSWRPIEVGDVTARYIQFRIRADSFEPFTRAVIDSGLVEIDAPDRIWKKTNIDVPAAGWTAIAWSPAFISKPVLAVTIEDASVGVVYELQNLDRSRVEIRLLNSDTHAQVAGRVDVAALGQGKLRATSI